MKTTVDFMWMCVDTHMECLERWSEWGIQSETFFVSTTMCAMAYDYIARGEY